MRLTMALVAIAAALLALTPNVWSRTDFYPVEDLRPGMKGIGKTCYQGSKPEDFQVEILGVLHGINPGADAVLARFSGGPLAQTGVFEGMSGSPVFIDGKLLGAVAFSFPFAKEAIGGITPIKQMVEAFAESVGATPTGPAVILKKSMLWNYPLRLPDAEFWNRGLPITPFDIRYQPSLAALAGHALQPIATPMSLSGFSQEAVAMFGPQFRSAGLTLFQGTGATAKTLAAPDNTPIEPGSNIVVPLVRGDMEAAAGGSVTYTDGDKLYAFGHPLFNLGFTELPLHKGRVMTVFPSIASSFKILETTDPIGVLRQDRSSGIYGMLGQKAKMIPVQVEVTTSRGAKKKLTFELAKDRLLTPLLVNLTVFNSIIASERLLGVSTLQVKGKIQIKGEQAVEIENRFSSDSNTPLYASLSIALPVHFLLASGYKNLEFENIHLDISALEDDRAAILDSIRVDRTELRAGEAVNLDIAYKKANGEMVLDSYPVKIPPDVTPGSIFILVADGTTLMSLDAREQGEDFIPRDLRQLIKFMNNIRKNDRLYVRIFRREAGAVIKGEGLPGLPPSILSILRSSRNSGGMNSLDTSTYMEYEVPPSDYVVSGSKTLTLQLKP